MFWWKSHREVNHPFFSLLVNLHPPPLTYPPSEIRPFDQGLFYPWFPSIRRYIKPWFLEGEYVARGGGRLTSHDFWLTSISWDFPDGHFFYNLQRSASTSPVLRSSFSMGETKKHNPRCSMSGICIYIFPLNVCPFLHRCCRYIIHTLTWILWVR